ncbi:hypothetical protein AGMMS50212_04470 [Spirochaetia bacterium]|nr:hypothetical protein AGMMS50212_04470 [Spirochaetia bacterium]
MPYDGSAKRAGRQDMAELFKQKHWDSKPVSGDLVIIGVAPLQRRTEDTIAAALDDAAKKAAMFYGVTVQSLSIDNEGLGRFDQYFSRQIDLSYDTGYQKYIDSFVFDKETDVFIEKNNAFVRVHLQTEIPLFVEYESAFIKRRGPAWISSPPASISGYMAAVGQSDAYRYYSDSIMASYKSAAGALITRVKSEMQTKHDAYEISGTTLASNVSIEKSSGTLREFFVIEIWIDPKDNSVWTLAVAK